MVEKKGLGKAIGHAFLWFGIAIVLFPLYIALVATTHTFDVLIGSTPLWFGGEFLKNFTTVLTQGLKAAGGIPVWVMMANSLVMALGIAIGKIAISITAAYAIVYFRFPGRELCFVLIFITLMMPVEVRIVPTFQVAANLNFIDSYLGLVLPLIASATATFLYRQMFMTIPAELLEAARIDGANEFVILYRVVYPMCKPVLTTIMVLVFIGGWNDLNGPLLYLQDSAKYTLSIGLQMFLTTARQEWDLLMAAGVDRVMTMDLHADQIQGFFDVPVDALYASGIFIPYIKSLNIEELSIAAPDMGGAKRANTYAKLLGTPIIISHKERAKANVVGTMTAIGEVEGRNILIVDDMIDTAGTICMAADMLMSRGAKSVRAAITHPVLSGPAYERINDSALQEVIVTDTIPLNPDKDLHKFTVLSVADMFADVIERVHNYKEISSIFFK